MTFNVTLKGGLNYPAVWAAPERERVAAAIDGEKSRGATQPSGGLEPGGPGGAAGWSLSIGYNLSEAWSEGTVPDDAEQPQIQRQRAALARMAPRRQRLLQYRGSRLHPAIVPARARPSLLAGELHPRADRQRLEILLRDRHQGAPGDQVRTRDAGDPDPTSGASVPGEPERAIRRTSPSTVPRIISYPRLKIGTKLLTGVETGGNVVLNSLSRKGGET